MAFLLASNNQEYQIKPRLARLGIGGIAVRSPCRPLLGDMLASVAIALDKAVDGGRSLQGVDLNGPPSSTSA